MVKLNLVSRVSVDKNFFVDLVYAIYQLKTKHGIIATVYFIGTLESEPVYQTVNRLVHVLDLEDQISFSKKPIRYDDMTDEVKSRFFINYCVGDFLGYSSIECLKHKLKAIFYNIEPEYSASMNSRAFVCYCRDMNSFIDLIRKIDSDEKRISEEVLKENQLLLTHFILQKNEEHMLASIMMGNPLKHEE
jgi:hypothetical protein